MTSRQTLTSELANMREDVLQSVCELKGVDVAKAILDVRVDHQLGQPQNLATQMEGVTETRLLSLLKITNNNIKTETSYKERGERWKSAFVLALVVSVLTGFKLKLKSRCK